MSSLLDSLRFEFTVFREKVSAVKRKQSRKSVRHHDAEESELIRTTNTFSSLLPECLYVGLNAVTKAMEKSKQMLTLRVVLNLKTS